MALRPGIRTPGRGASGVGTTLETVQESSLPATPAIGTIDHRLSSRASTSSAADGISEHSADDPFARPTRSAAESGNESGGTRSGDQKKDEQARQKPPVASNISRPKTVPPKRSLTQLNSARGKVVGEGSVRNMTVETETVSSVPQVAVGGGAGERGLPGRTDNPGSVRLKASTETIRPKKEKKKVVRKTPSINSGTGGSLSRHNANLTLLYAYLILQHI